MKRMMRRSLVIGLLVSFLCGCAQYYRTRHGNAILEVTPSTYAERVIQLQSELKPRNYTRIDRVYLVTPSGKKLYPSDKTTFAEQKVATSGGGKKQVELADERTAATYLADVYLFELPEDERKGRWFFYAQGPDARGQMTGYRIEIPQKDIDAVMKGAPIE